MYYKLQQNGAVTAVVTRRCWMRYQAKHGLFVPCAEECADGILADDGGVYHIDGRSQTQDDTFQTAYPITRAEYLALADELGVEVEPSVEDGALALARADYIAMMTDVDMEGIA